MAKKRKEISLDDLEEELAEQGEDLDEIEEEEEEEIEEIEEFDLEEISTEEEIGEVFEEEFEEPEISEEVGIPEEEIIDERIYIVPLKKARKGPRTKWAKKAVRYLREFIEQHFKPEYLVISQEVNEKIWAHGIQKPPRKLRVLARKNVDGLVYLNLAE
ncbi:MAG: 50S ribosomal protein L31e [Promethearchaeota archaeon]|nr:MAG: 50S ribosomal protein L31e [Candidatus Lokiarchaeota archaeon]